MIAGSKNPDVNRQCFYDMKYVAFLRGVNVGGRSILKMESLVEMFTGLGFKNVDTFNQTGNVFFESEETAAYIMEKRIEKACLENFGYPVILVIKRYDDLLKWVGKNVFKPFKKTPDLLLHVTLFSFDNQTPVNISKKNIEFIAEFPGAIFSVSKIVHGRYISPNDFVEREYGIPATTRDWDTIKGLVGKYKKMALR